MPEAAAAADASALIRIPAAAGDEKKPRERDGASGVFSCAVGVAQTVTLLDGFEFRLPPESLLARSENW